MSPRPHFERHLVERIGWLRAAVLGANDGIVSTASLIVGVAAGAAGRNEILLAGIAVLSSRWTPLKKLLRGSPTA